MSRYTLLFILNLPFVLAALLNIFINYKLGKSSKRSSVLRTFFWAIILLGLAFAQPLYDFLFSHKLTESEPLSLFDVVQITAIIIVFYVANRSRAKVENLEKRVQDLHQELSIRLSLDENQPKKD